MPLFVCESFGPFGGCNSWVELPAQNALLPELSRSQALELGGAVVGVWVIALLMAVLIRTVAQKKL